MRYEGYKRKRLTKVPLEKNTAETLDLKFFVVIMFWLLNNLIL